MTPTHRWTGATVDLSAVPAGGMAVRLAAGAGDRRAIADRLGLPAVEHCAASLALRPEAGRGTGGAHGTPGTRIEGRLSARLVRRCVVTGDPMTETVEQPVECLVLAAAPAAGEDEPAGPDGPDIETAPDGLIDLAELAVQTLAVSMTAYPRGPDADAALADFQAGESSAAGDPGSPFAGLADRLGMPAGRTGGGEGGDGGA